MKYIYIIIISVILSVGITYSMNKQSQVGDGDNLGTAITTILSTDQISDSRTTINDNFTALNNAIHWYASTTNSTFLYSSSTDFGILLNETSSSTMGNLKLTNTTSTNATTSLFYISTGLTNAGVSSLQAASTTNLAITGISGSTQCLQINTNGTITGHGSTCNSSAAAWKYDSGADAMITTSTKGIYITASSSFQTDLRIDGNATTTGSFYIDGDLFVGNSNSALQATSSVSGALTATSSITVRNIDQTVTTNFKPKLIKIDYYVSGATAQNTNVYKQGAVYFSGTALTGGYTFTCDAGTDPETVCSAASFGITLPDGTPTLVAGTATAGADDVQATISLQSVSDTGFTWRCAVDPGAGDATEEGHCKGFYSAFR